MSSIARIYRAEIMRAVLGPKASELKAHDIARLNQIAERLADSELAQSALQAKGYGRSGASFVELVREVPTNVRQILKGLFKPRTPVSYSGQAEVHDIWSAR